MIKNKSFLNSEKPVITVMAQADNPDRISELVSLALHEGAEAFGMQFCQLSPLFREKSIYEKLFAMTEGRPVYATNYRYAQNEGKSDEVLARELIELAECGATLCDVMGDYFDATRGELTMKDEAVKQQMQLIDDLHSRGAEVLISTHVFKYTHVEKELQFIPAERVLEIALEHQRRGADISKIVIGADNMAEQIEGLRILNLLKENLKIPFLFLLGGECYISRRISGALGNCMTLCVYEHDDFSTKSQPTLKEVKALRGIFEV